MVNVLTVSGSAGSGMTQAMIAIAKNQLSLMSSKVFSLTPIIVMKT